jgi:hypothetical protein
MMCAVPVPAKTAEIQPHHTGEVIVPTETLSVQRSIEEEVVVEEIPVVTTADDMITTVITVTRQTGGTTRPKIIIVIMEAGASR